ncbi:MAG: NfeD family protein [Cytophagaceae bacterium]
MEIVITLLVVSLLLILAWKFGIHKKAWNKVSLEESLTGRVNDDVTKPAVGLVGMAISDLRPYGKAELDGREFEVKTSGEFLKAGTKISVMRITSDNVIIVKSII